MEAEEGSTAKQLARLLAGLDRAFRDDFKRSNGVPQGLTLAQYQVITLIAEKGECSQKTIANRLGVTGPTVVRIIDALERKGLVRRTRHERDRRIVQVALTERGVQTQRDCEQMHEMKIASMLERLPANIAETLLSSLSELLTATGHMVSG